MPESFISARTFFASAVSALPFLVLEYSSHFPSSLTDLQYSEKSPEDSRETPSIPHIHFFPIMSATLNFRSYFFFISERVSMAMACCVCLDVRKNIVRCLSMACFRQGPNAAIVFPSPVGA